MKFRILSLFILIQTVVFSKNDTSSLYFEQQQNKIKTINQKLFHTKKLSDTDKYALNAELISLFEETLNNPDSYKFSFDSLKNDMGILTSPDNTFKIIHWNIANNDGTFKYFGFIQLKFTSGKKNKTESILVFPLIDKSAEIKNAENHISDNKKWFGMLYYKIIPLKTKNKTYYTLLGWDGNDKISQKKFIDVLSFDTNGNPRFGADIFDIPKKNPKRIAFEFAHNCAFVLRYNENLNMIVFDRLSPIEPQLTGQYQYYCTGDFEYDGFKIKKGKWLFQENIAPRNDKNQTDKLYQNPEGKSIKPESNVLIEKEKKKKKK
jgi:hypothetical protein